MKTDAICMRLLVPTVICAVSALAVANAATQRADDLLLSNSLAGASVDEAPLILSDFDRSARLQHDPASSAGGRSLAGAPIVGSLVGPERISLPRAGGSTSVTLAVQGLTLTARPVSLPSGVSVSLSGNRLTVVSTANRGRLERTGSFVITAQSPNNPLGGKLRGVLTVGISQLPCTTATCPTPNPAPPVNIVMTSSPKAPGVAWSAVEASMRARAAAGVALIVIDGANAPSRTSGAAVAQLARLCAATGLKCILELSSQSGSAASRTAPSAYFLSPDVHAALYGAEAQLMLSLRGEAQLDGGSGAINQLRSAGLGHTLLISQEGAERSLATDPYHNILLAAENAKAAASAKVPAIVVPQVVIAAAPLVPVDFEINGRALVVDRSLVAFDGAGGAASLRFLQSGGLRWAVRKVPSSFVQGGGTFPQNGRVALTVGASSTTRSERVEFSAKTANGVVTLFIDVAVIQDADGSVF